MKFNKTAIFLFLLFFTFCSTIYAKNSKTYIKISIKQQNLQLIKNNKVIKQYQVSTAVNGIGNKVNSGKTPLGKHRIIGLFGKNQPKGMIFKFCKPTGKIAKIHNTSTKKSTDLLTTRVIQLEGLEKGINLGNDIDSFKRGIMIHGTPDEFAIGKKASHGCIRLKNNDIIKLFKHLKKGMVVNIVND